jgi:rhodanese-related sulfurtransferase
MMVVRTLIAVPCAVSLMLALAPAFGSEPAACSADTLTSPASSLPDHDPALARRLVASGGLLLDVRTGEEYANRHIEGAVNIPIGELKGRLAEIERLTGSDKRTPIVVYCASGRRAQQAKDVLLEAGYEQVTNLGGIDDWNRR